jgi:hypothetical protein
MQHIKGYTGPKSQAGAAFHDHVQAWRVDVLKKIKEWTELSDGDWKMIEASSKSLFRGLVRWDSDSHGCLFWNR